MKHTADKASTAQALLPAGLGDLLPTDAAQEAALVERLMATFAQHGYDRVSPPLIEFEDTLLAGPGAALAHQTFRLMDPVSQRMMGVRADMTLQVARIARTRLGKAPRPLRLSYAGQVLRVKGTQLRPERQFGQVGVELVGALEADADAELVLLAATALRAAGVTGLSVDLTVPTLVTSVCQALGLDEATLGATRAALDRRDAAALDALPAALGTLLTQLLAAAGPAREAVAALARIALPESAEPDRRRLVQVVEIVSRADPDLQLTVDPVEQRGFEFQTGLSFTLFGRGVRGELGRGGRYRVGGDIRTGEPATGFTLYTDTVLRAVPPLPAPRRVLLPHGTAPAEGARLRAEGWNTRAALAPVADPAAEARRLGCSHLYEGGAVVAV
jgi:ATP phosphoribosyltransferase regulatory subunit